MGLVSGTDLCTRWDSQQASLQAPRVTLRSAYVADQSSEFSACLNLLWDCPGFQGLTDPSLIKSLKTLPQTVLGCSSKSPP